MPSSGTWRLESENSSWAIARRQNELPLADEYEERATGGNWPIWVIPLLLSVTGIVMIASLTSRSAHAEGVSYYWMASRQLAFLCAGIILMYFCCLVPLSFMRRMSWLLWLSAVVMVFATLIPGLGVTVNGSRRWLDLGFQFQPIEILTLGMPMFLADRLSASRREDFKCFCKPTLSIAVISAAAIFFQPSMGGVILVFGICMSMHVVGRGWKYPLTGAMFLLVIFTIMILYEPYRLDRLKAFFDPWLDEKGKGYQIIQGLVAFCNGGLLGMGLGKGLQVKYLPEAHTDYIFPVIGEEFGIAGTLLVVFLYAAWTYKAYTLYRRSNKPYISVLIWGLTASILFPMFINLGGVMKLMPLTGMPLPFISFGGTSLVAMWIKIGILLRIAKEISRGETGMRR